MWRVEGDLASFGMAVAEKEGAEVEFVGHGLLFTYGCNAYPWR